MKKFVTFFSCAVLAAFFHFNFVFSQDSLLQAVAPNFNLKDVSGKKMELNSFADNKGIILVFTCNHCPFAKMYESRIMALDKNFKEKGFPVVAISPNDPGQVPDDSYANMKTLAKEKGYTFPYLIDETSEVARAYKATKTPHVYVLKKEGDNFIIKYIGAIDNNAQDETAVTEKYVEDAIASILKGEVVAKPFTKAIGCGIKFKAL